MKPKSWRLIRSMNNYTFRDKEVISSADFVDLLRRSTLAERRPIDDLDCLDSMLKNADITITCCDPATGQLLGIARSVTDFSYCCYLSDLAVDEKFQGQGIGTRLIEETRKLLGPQCNLILLSAPDANEFYPKIGFEKHERAWVKSGG